MRPLSPAQHTWMSPALAAALLVVVFGTVRLALGASADDPVLAAWLGGARIPVLVAGGQSWRLVTAALLHLDPAHLAGNAAGVALLGDLLVRLTSGPRFWTVFLGTAIVASVAGGLASPAWSMGASGGVAGLLGALAGQGYRHWDAWGPRLRRRFLATTLPWAVLLAAVPFVTHGTFAPDHVAHMAGLACGVGLGTVLSRPRRYVEVVAAASAGLLVAVSFFRGAQFAAQQSAPPGEWQTVTAEGVAYDVPADWVPAPTPDPENCDVASTSGVLVVCVGLRVDATAEALTAEAVEAGFVADAPAPFDPWPTERWPEVLGFRPGPDRRPHQRLLVLMGPSGAVRPVLVVHALTTAALDERARVVLRRIAGSVAR